MRYTCTATSPYVISSYTENFSLFLAILRYGLPRVFIRNVQSYVALGTFKCIRGELCQIS